MSYQQPPFDYAEQKPDKIKRGYRACLHCRSRKAKCDLGDIDAPSSPPCSRCKRESRECVFAPSRRGGNNKRRQSASESHDNDSLTENQGQGHSSMSIDGPGRGSISRDTDMPMMIGSSTGTGNGTGLGAGNGTGTGAGNFRPTNAPREPSFQYPPPSTHPIRPSPGFSHGQSEHRPSYGASIHDLIHKSPSANIYSIQRGPTSTTPTTIHDPTPPAHIPTSSTPSPKRRRLHLNPPLHVSDPSSIVIADMQNESDALNILALASGQADSEDSRRRDDKSKATLGQGASETRRGSSDDGDYRDKGKGKAFGAGSKNDRNKEPPSIQDFALIKLGVLDKDHLIILTDAFFRHHHHFFPMVPMAEIPQTLDQLASFARDERYFLTAAVIIASKHHTAKGMKQVHDKAWAVFRGWITDIQCLGAPPTIDLIEALLLLAENLPRDPARSAKRDEDVTRAVGVGEEVHGAENRQAWMLIGTAIRSAYGLGIEKLAMKLFTEVDKTPELERSRLAWTYCYLFDRHISLRLGRAFWSRGPAVCFQGFSSSAQTGPAAAAGNFPSLTEDESGAQDDYSCLVQAYLELTQMMSTAHDTLWPNPSRTRSLMIYGEYFKYVDELARSIDGFRILWAHKKWNTFPLTDCVAAMLHYTTLVVTAFSFQSHLERSAMRAEEENKKLEERRARGEITDATRPSLSLFPRGAAHSPDARYIFQSCDSARALLEICVDRLHPGGALPYLPWRFLLWFTYAAVLLLKALYSGAMLRADHAKTLTLIDRLCACFSKASEDDDHPAVRYGRQLEALNRKLSVMSDSNNANSPTGGHQVPLPQTQQANNESQHRPANPYTNNSASYSSNGQVNAQWPPGYQPNNQTTPRDKDPLGFDSAASPWSLPVHAAQTPNPFTFPYPDDPFGLNMASQVAPPNQQPMSELNTLPAGQLANPSNLGFATLDDWFGQSNNPGMEGQDGDEGDLAGGLDLQDFWFQVGPGEAQGGFPFR